MSPSELLAFESRWPRNTPDKRQAIRQLGLSEARYYVLLGRAASSVEGIVADPVTARMVRDRAEQAARVRERRTAA